ncbi:SDR family oxidoreductase [Microbacterium trichothecenolyticum]|uniref:SDR family NAD(P)-dependent oxidoreductase n=1 Tax=Microbacterium trichothecenolyticum TaxID=69370 RepID=UPI001C6F0209|nr:SDR family oxidoreductase [Microbacterium trichothecenolyticum]MBW9121753.1 SDR family oxidoreductase [Microbacterium trichothecenolyticum]
MITGGGTGIGKAIGGLFGSDGWDVLAVGLLADEDLPQGVSFARADITDSAALIDATAGDRPVDALVTCAAVLRDRAEWEPSTFSSVIDVNVTAALTAAEQLKPRLAAQGGAIVNFASMWSYFGTANAPGYAASKGAIVALTRSQAVAYAPLGIRANAVAPGWIETPMSTRAQEDQTRRAAIDSRIPLGRWGRAEDVARAVRFLTSEDSGYITGTVLNVDGGYSIA